VLDELTLDYPRFLDARGHETLGLIPRSANPVAIHVRRGDFSGHDGNLLLADRYYNDSIREMERRVSAMDFTREAFR